MKKKRASDDEDVKKLDVKKLLLRMQNSVASMQNIIKVSQKLRIELPYDPAIPVLGINPRADIKISRRR